MTEPALTNSEAFLPPAIVRRAVAALEQYHQIIAGLDSTNSPVEGAADARMDPFIVACKQGELEKVATAIEADIDIHAYEDLGVRWAAGNNHIETVNLLVAHGADIQAKNNMALQVAAQFGRTEMVRLLIKHGADIRARDNLAIRYAAQHGHIDIVRLLIAQGANIQADDNYAVRWAANNGHTEIVRLLIEHDADIQANHNDAVRRAAANGHTETLRLLIAQGADIHAQNHYAIRYAAQNGHIETVRLLIAHDAQFKAGHNYAMRSAADNGYFEIVSLLLEHGVSRLSLDPEHRPALDEYHQRALHWRKILRRDPPPHLYKEDPTLFKGACFEAVRRMLAVEGYNNKAGSLMAFYTAALFQSETRVLQYLKQWGGAGTQPLHDLVQMIKVPSGGTVQPNLKDWADGVLKCGPSMARLVKFADKLSSPIKTADGQTWSMVRTRAECARYGFNKAAQNPELAALCFEHDVDEDTFEKALAVVQAKKPMHKNIPDINLAGEAFGMAGGRFRRLADGDLRGLFLGQMTDCCQWIGHDSGDACALHGFTSPEGGFYVVENAKGKIVGQSWAWRGKNDELCLDSLETLGGNVTDAQWGRIIKAFMAELDKGGAHDVRALTVGSSGATGDSCPGLKKSFILAAQAVPRDYNGYRDSKDQILIWASTEEVKSVSAGIPINSP